MFHASLHMKVAMIGQKGTPAIFGGIERHVEELSTRLSNIGMDVIVYCRRWYCEEREAAAGPCRIFVPSLHTKHLDAITHTFFATLHAIFIAKPDVIHYHGVGPSLCAWIPRLLSPRTRVVVTFHSLDRTHDKWGRFARLMLRTGEWSACRFADRTIAVSKTLENYCRDVYNIDVSYLPNGVTTFPESNPGALTEWNLAPGRYILFVGRLIRLKGVHTLVAAYRQLPAEYRAKYSLVITGEACDQNYVRELTKLARGANVKFVGNQTGSKLAALYRGAAIFVQPSECESMPIVVLEAAGEAVPVIASDIAAHREILKDEGVYFESRNILELAACLQETLGDLDGAKERAKIISARILDTYAWDKIASETKDVYLATAPLRAALPETEEI
jgi:glycosyltransferase involved in cell wall biosynthesis